MEVAERLDEEPDRRMSGCKGGVQSIVSSFRIIVCSRFLVFYGAVDVPQGLGIGCRVHPRTLEVIYVLNDRGGKVEKQQACLELFPAVWNITERKKRKAEDRVKEGAEDLVISNTRYFAGSFELALAKVEETTSQGGVREHREYSFVFCCFEV